MSAVSDVAANRVIIELPEELADVLASKAAAGQTIEQIAIQLLSLHLKDHEIAQARLDALIRYISWYEGLSEQDVRAELSAQVKEGSFVTESVAAFARFVATLAEPTPARLSN